jgi:hypothetical protein
MARRIREEMRELFPKKAARFGDEGKTVEMNETFTGELEENKHRSKRKHKGTGGIGKRAVYSLVDRNGRVRSHHVPQVNAANLVPILEAQLDGASFVLTRVLPPRTLAAPIINLAPSTRASANRVRGEQHRGLFSILVRGINGTCRHVSQQRLDRYLVKI